VKRGLPILVILALAVTAATPTYAQVFFRGTFNLAEAYPCSVGSYDASAGITTPQLFSGRCPAVPAATGASPGILCLQRQGTALDANCFAVIPFGQTGPCFVQSYRLTKEVPGSFKCPDVYGLAHGTPYRYFQFGTGVRTWWSLTFTQPGTQFMLEVVSVCRAAATTQIDPTTGQTVLLSAGGEPRIHKDLWVWRVVADENTMASLIELMHEGAVSTLETPCILGEDMYDALKKARQRLADAIVTGDLNQISSAVFDFEALIVSNCLFIEVLNPLDLFKGADQFGGASLQPPGNVAPTVTFRDGGTAVAGIIDTLEHPCCCKLLVDLESIAIQNGAASPFPVPIATTTTP
jgi:hypothetical protein